MTTSTDLDRLSLRTPDALLSALPYLLGFHPHDSLVAVWLARGRMVLTQRMDLPGPSGPDDGWLAALWTPAAAVEAQEVVLVVLSAADPSRALTDAVLARAREQGVDVRDLIHSRGDRWRSLLCRDQACCPPEGRILDPSVAAAVAAEFTALGRAPLASRAELAQTLAPDPAVVAQVAAIRRRLPSPSGRERWRDARIAEVLDALVGDPSAAPSAPPSASPSPAAISRMLQGLADVRVRDTVLWEASHWAPDEAQAALESIGAVVRGAPAGLVAPVATCAALLAWLAGDGARALVALQRAHDDDPDYSLALLLSASLQRGLPPAVWREAMASLTRATCRHGDDPGLRE